MTVVAALLFAVVHAACSGDVEMRSTCEVAGGVWREAAVGVLHCKVVEDAVTARCDCGFQRCWESQQQICRSRCDLYDSDMAACCAQGSCGWLEAGDGFAATCFDNFDMCAADPACGEGRVCRLVDDVTVRGACTNQQVELQTVGACY